jgi:hypothetical protein
MSFELTFVVLLLSLSNIDVFQTALGRVLYGASSNPSVESLLPSDVIEVPEGLLAREDEVSQQGGSSDFEKMSEKEFDQLMTLSALAEALGEKNKGLRNDLLLPKAVPPPFNIEQEVPVLLMASPEEEDRQKQKLNEVVENLEDENDLLKKEVATLVSALEDSAKVLDSQDQEKAREEYLQLAMLKLLAAENMEEQMEKEDGSSYEPIIYIPKDTSIPQPQKRDDNAQLGNCDAMSRLTDGCSRLQSTFHLTMDREAIAACSAHQLCYTCAFPLTEAIRGCDDIYVKQTNYMCDTEESGSTGSRCHFEADQLLQLMRVQHMKSAEVRATEIEDEELRGMCESPCAVSAMLLK